MADHPDHYQAVNVEHLDNSDASARMELRRIPAQTDLGKLQNDVRGILGIVAEVRGEVFGQQLGRLMP